MAEDWLADVRKYVAGADENVVKAIVRYCGIALQNRDSSLVAMSDPKETDRVRENYLKKKLGLTQSDDVLDAAIQSVGQRMKEDRTKNRVTVYYLLAEHFGLLNIFGGVAGVAGAAGLAAAAMSGDDDKDEGGSAAPLAAAGLGAAAVGASAAAAPPPASPVAEPVMAASAPEPAPAATPDYAAANYGDDDSGGGGMGWLKWLLLAALLAALIFFLLRFCAPQEAAPAGDATTTEAVGGETADAEATDTTATDTAATDATTAAAAPIPTGAGIVAGERSGKPMLTVYFDSGKADITKDFPTVGAVIKDYMAKNPTAKLAVSGYNDPTGNAAFNAELSKRRAQAVGKSLEGLGVPEAAIELVKPEAATDAAVDKATARRVEVTVK